MGTIIITTIATMAIILTMNTMLEFPVNRSLILVLSCDAETLYGEVVS